MEVHVEALLEEEFLVPTEVGKDAVELEVAVKYNQSTLRIVKN
jgi:hypothetical protein